MVRILAATDFSDEARPVLDFTANMVRKCGGKMYLLHAVEPCMINAAGSLPAEDLLGIIPPQTAQDDVLQQCKCLLERADARAKQLAADISHKWDIPIYGKAEEADDIVDCIHGFCKRHNIDILVIGNRHHSLLSSILLGNTAEKLVRTSTIPVTVVPCGEKAKH